MRYSCGNRRSGLAGRAWQARSGPSGPVRFEEEYRLTAGEGTTEARGRAQSRRGPVGIGMKGSLKTFITANCTYLESPIWDGAGPFGKSLP